MITGAGSTAYATSRWRACWYRHPTPAP